MTDTKGAKRLRVFDIATIEKQACLTPGEDKRWQVEQFMSDWFGYWTISVHPTRREARAAIARATGG